MPMDFPDMKSLEQAAECWKFRKPNEGESEAEYRTALADFVEFYFAGLDAEASPVQEK